MALDILSETSEKCWLDIDASAASAFVADVSARILKQEGVIAGLEKRLANKAYVSGAPSHVVLKPTRFIGRRR